MRQIIFPALIGIAFGPMAHAQEADAPKSFAELYPPLPGVEYYCTDSDGGRADIGSVICVTASCQTWMARCEMAASNRMAMWRKVQDGCPAVDAAPSVLDRLEALQQTL
ncbi:MAG: hypothetical protein AAGP08_04255 [Pseudomonadota bacterium]